MRAGLAVQERGALAEGSTCGPSGLLARVPEGRGSTLLGRPSVSPGWAGAAPLPQEPSLLTVRFPAGCSGPTLPSRSPVRNCPCEEGLGNLGPQQPQG